MEWHIFIDGASSGNPGESGAGIIAFDSRGSELYRDSVYLGHMTNNRAEYEALILALERASKSSVKHVYIYTDSLLVANQVTGKYKIKDLCLLEYVKNAKVMIERFNSFALKHIPREKNRIADKLAKEAANRKG